MNEAHFEILGITMPSGKYQFHDDGYVNSISEAAMWVNELYGLDNSNYNTDEDKSVIGRHYRIGLNHHIFYLKQLSNLRNIAVRAHEETHALEGMNGLDYLTDVLLETQRVKINLKEVDEKEVRAELGAIYALYSRGLTPWRFVLDSFFRKDFIKARKLYNQSKLPERRFFT